MSIAANKALALRYFKLVEEGHIDDALALASDDARFWHPASGESTKEGLRAAYRQFAPLFKSFRTTVLSVTAEENRVAVELEANIDLANGRHYHNRYLFLLAVHDAKIVSVSEYVDTKAFEAALAG